MDIKEIALRIGEEADDYADAKLQSKGEFHPDWHTVRDEYFTEALIESYKAELLKEVGEPVYQVCKSDSISLSSAWVDVTEQAYNDAGLYPEYGRRILHTSDKVAAAIAKTTKPLEEKLSWLDYTEKMNKALGVEIEELTAQFAAAQEEIANETAEACAKYVNRFLNGDGIQDEAWIRDIESGIRRGAWKEFK